MTYEERSRRFNETTGVFGYMTASGPRGGNHHPDRCRCQGDPFPGDGRGDRAVLASRRAQRHPHADTTPHKHYDRPPFSCARCRCSAYVPTDEAKKQALREQARAIIEQARGVA